LSDVYDNHAVNNDTVNLSDKIKVWQNRIRILYTQSTVLLSHWQPC